MKINEEGSVLLVVMVIMLVASLVIAAAITLILSGSSSTTRVEVAQMAYQAAESGVDEAQLRLLRDPNFTGNVSNIPVGVSTADITVSSAWPKTIDSYGKYGGVIRHIRITATFNSGILTITALKEI